MSDELNQTGLQELSAKQEKKHSRKPWVIGLIVVAFIITGGVGLSFAKKLKHLHDDGPLGVMLDKISKDLDLNEQQKAGVENIKKEIKAKMESRKQNHENRFAEFENLFKSDNLDKKTLTDLYQKHEADRNEMREFFTDELIKFHDLLTPDQRTKTVEKLKDMREKFKDGKEGFFHPKDGPPPENH